MVRNAKRSDETAPTALFADEKNLWIGTAQNGVLIFDGKRSRQESSLEKLRRMPIRKITKENENVFWFSGESGLFRFENGNLQTIPENQDVRDFAIIGADIWAATLRGGLFHLKFDETLGWLSSDTNVEQGLPSEQIFSILPLGNSLLIGTNRGVVSYSPSDVAPKIIATRVLSQRLYNKYEIARLIEREFPQNSLLLEVAGLNSRTFPEQFQYGFLLKNQNGEIIDKKLSSEAQFSPTDLSPGNYTIEARAFNKDLLASESLTINFSVARAPFPWTAPALEFLLAHTFNNYEFSAAENAEEKVNFSPNVQMQIYRIAQEILNNIKHHSDAKIVSMKAEISPENEFFLFVEDDGKFFDPEKIVSKGRGIGNIKSRAALIEAEISWRENETGGTIFRLAKRS